MPPPNDPFLPLPYPYHGLDQSSSASGQRPLTTPQSDNVRAIEPKGNRMRGGRRPALAKTQVIIPTGPHLIQHLQVVVDPNARALNIGEPTGGPWGDDCPPGFVADPGHPGRCVPIGGGPFPPPETTRKYDRIDWSDPDDVCPGVALSGTQLNAVASDADTLVEIPGTYTYSPASGAVIGAGLSQPLHVHFVPDDSAYPTLDATVHINARFIPLSLVQYEFQEQAVYSPIPVSFGLDVQAGSTVVVVVETSVTAQQSPSPLPLTNIGLSLTDTQSNSYTQRDHVALTGGFNSGVPALLAADLYLFTAPVASAGTLTLNVACTFDPINNEGHVGVLVFEFRKTSTVTPVAASGTAGTAIQSFNPPDETAIDVSPVAPTGDGQIALGVVSVTGFGIMDPLSGGPAAGWAILSKTDPTSPDYSPGGDTSFPNMRAWIATPDAALHLAMTCGHNAEPENTTSPAVMGLIAVIRPPCLTM